MTVPKVTVKNHICQQSVSILTITVVIVNKTSININEPIIRE